MAPTWHRSLSCLTSDIEFIVIIIGTKLFGLYINATCKLVAMKKAWSRLLLDTITFINVYCTCKTFTVLEL